jgi:hypothetical protein
MLVNVGIGLWFIFKHESKNPNRPLLEAQMREQIAKSIERAAALTPAPNVLGVTEITISAATGKMDSVANEVVTIVGRLGGSATKGLQDSNRLSVLVDVPSNREQEFRAQVASIAEKMPASSASATVTGDKSSPDTEAMSATGEKKSFIVQIVDTTPR